MAATVYEKVANNYDVFGFCYLWTDFFKIAPVLLEIAQKL